MEDRYQIFTFEKSYADRCEEYRDIFNSETETSTFPTRMKAIWTEYLKSFVEPIGWSALWKLTDKSHVAYSAYSGTILYVMVDSIDFDTLRADLTCLEEAEDTAEGANFYDVPLKELYPTSSQENCVHRIDHTAECIDQLRTFYEHLYCPWDEYLETLDVLTSTQWESVYLDVRLKIYYNMYVDQLKYPSVQIVWGLMKKAKKLYSLVKHLTRELDATVIDDSSKTLDLTSKMYLKDFFKGLLDISESEISYCQEETTKKNLPLVIAVINQIANKDDIAKIKIPAHLMSTTEWTVVKDLPYAMADPDVYVALCEDEIHRLYDMTCLTQGGTMIGVNCTPTIKDFNLRMNLCNFIGAETKLLNLKFELETCNEVIRVHRNCRLKMSDVKLQHKSKTATSAVVLYDGASLEADRCSFIGFGVSIIAFTKSLVILNNCTFTDNDLDIKAFDDSEIRLNDTNDVKSRNTVNKYTLPPLL